jgi:serine phosphatase RsbU (regulator of sigma subunit)
MTSLHSQSPAFRQALLKSERLRIVILLSLLGVFLALRIVRTVIAWNPENAAELFWLASFAMAMGILEAYVLRAIRPGIQTGQDLSHYSWLGNILVEACIPGLIIAFMANSSAPAQYRVITNPIFGLYFLVISLSVLRLSERVSWLCGLFASGSYLAAAYHHGWRPADAMRNLSLLAPQKIVVTYAISLLAAGVAAGLVAREIRKQVEAALREAEARRAMEHLQHDLEVARHIQRSLLPASMPQVPGFEIAAWNKSADQTSGDYYDWQQLADGRFVVALADVTGHGIGPALLAAVCRAYSRAVFGQHAGFLESMTRINSAIAADVGEGRFVTFVAAIVSPTSPQVELLSAGHAPLFIYWLQHDRFDKMEAQGLPLGISPELMSEPPQSFPFDSGDMLVLCTDGFFEWANAKEELFGSDRLEKSIRSNREKPAAEIISSLYQDVIAFSGGTPQNDDLTAIVIKRI